MGLQLPICYIFYIAHRSLPLCLFFLNLFLHASDWMIFTDKCSYSWILSPVICILMLLSFTEYLFLIIYFSALKFHLFCFIFSVFGWNFFSFHLLGAQLLSALVSIITIAVSKSSSDGSNPWVIPGLPGAFFSGVIRTCIVDTVNMLRRLWILLWLSEGYRLFCFVLVGN